MIKSISYDEQEILRSILRLHCQTPIEVDATFSTGNFYKKGIERPKYIFDLYPKSPEVIEANAEKLPLEDESVMTIMFDPPFLATTGKSLLIDNDRNKLNRRFGVYPNEKSLHRFYVNALREFHRILKPQGILIFKCQDKISSGKQYLSHYFIIREAERIGYYPKDIFILLAKQRIIADWQRRNQKNARKFHSYFIVFEKSERKVEYT